MNPFFSIIIPVYNAEKLLRKSVDSILNQGFKSFEIILVDDGSSDRSASVCKELERTDSRVVFIHQENQGVSAARNMGMSVAKGKYVFFVDADDYIEKDTLQMLHESTRGGQIDICFFGYRHIADDRIRQTVLPIRFSGEKNPDMLLALIESNTFGLACNKTVKRELIQANGILFDHTIRIFEDQEMMMRVWDCASQICCMDSPFYYYVISGTSAMQRFQSSQCERYFSMHDVNLKRLEGFMLKNGIGQDDFDAYAFKYISVEIGNIVRMAGLGSQTEFHVFTKLLDKSELMKVYERLYCRKEGKSVKEKAFWLMTRRQLSVLLRWAGKAALKFKK